MLCSDGAAAAAVAAVDIVRVRVLLLYVEVCVFASNTDRGSDIGTHHKMLRRKRCYRT